MNKLIHVNKEWKKMLIKKSRYAKDKTMLEILSFEILNCLFSNVIL